MPFKSQAQRKFMYARHPEIAKRWEKVTPKGKLPEKVASLTDFYKLAISVKVPSAVSQGIVSNIRSDIQSLPGLARSSVARLPTGYAAPLNRTATAGSQALGRPVASQPKKLSLVSPGAGGLYRSGSIPTGVSNLMRTKPLQM